MCLASVVLAFCGSASSVLAQEQGAVVAHSMESPGARAGATSGTPVPPAIPERQIRFPAALEPDPDSNYLFDTANAAEIRKPGAPSASAEREIHVPAELAPDPNSRFLHGPAKAAATPKPAQPATSPEREIVVPAALEPAPPEQPDTESAIKASREISPPSDEPDPIVVAVAAKLEPGAQTQYRGHEQDLAALKAFYTVGDQRLLWVDGQGFSARAKQVIAEIGKADDWGLERSAFELPVLPESGRGADVLADAEIKLGLSVLKYARHARGGRLNPRSVSRLFDQKAELLEPISVLLLIEKSASADAFLRELHPQHPQFNRLRMALFEARQAAKSRGGDSATDSKKKGKKARSKSGSRATIRRIVANMERWRWIPRDLGEFYIWDDVPEQTTSVIKNGKTILKEKIVVGKASTPTPMFSSELLYIIFHPSWGVPPGMKRNELGPQLRNTGGGGWFSNKPLASTVLKSHGLTVTRGGVRINPDSVDWSTANISSYHFTQPPGPKNVLGIVKFRFPNKHNVYMHDTPERHLFNGRKRTFSHGCMRVQNPVRLAEVLLKQDKGWGPGEVAKHKRRGSSITLTKPIPVHIAYFTVHVDDAGKTQVRSDIYGVDSRVASALERRSVHVGSVASGKKPRATSRRSSVRKKKKRQRASAKKKPWNPFESMHENGG
ncbi:MAG: L,D-transpeptidase family protein [Alphaproteobacteria bacterium]|nr:L,D-transpeptidase family protein [Alphaproteobacteria bacterium]